MRADFDVAIVGGGHVGLALGCALAGAGISAALVEARLPAPAPGPDEWDSRIYALSPGVAQFLERCGAWGRLEPSRVTRMRSATRARMLRAWAMPAT